MADLFAKAGQEPIVVIEDGEMRILSHDRSEEVVAMLTFNGKLTIQDLQCYCGALLHDRYVDRPLPRHELAEIIPRKAIPVGLIPKEPVLKMMKAEHAELLVGQGKLRLGSIEAYRKEVNPEIGDKTEGHCILAAFDGTTSHVRKVVGGLNDRLLCCYVGSPNWEVVRRFGYDTAVQITDVQRFAEAVADKINAKSYSFSSCVYVRDRVIYDDVLDRIDPQRMMDGQFSEMLGEARAFLKHNAYKHQSEFRFVWRTGQRIMSNIDVTIPALTQLCRQVQVPQLS